MSGQDRVGGPIDPGSRRDRRKMRKQVRRQARDAAWHAFPELEGTHLTIRLTAGGWAVSTRDGERLLATIEGGKRSLRLAPRSFRDVEVLRTVCEVRITDGPVYRSKSGWLSERFLVGPDRFFVDADSGEPAIKVVSRHFERKAAGRVHVLSQAGAIDVGPHIWRFPVEATNAENAVMTAVDDLGKTMMHFRRTPGLKESLIWLSRVVSDDAGIDIVLSPGLQCSPELLLITSVVPWIITYFYVTVQALGLDRPGAPITPHLRGKAHWPRRLEADPLRTTDPDVPMSRHEDGPPGTRSRRPHEDAASGRLPPPVTIAQSEQMPGLNPQTRGSEAKTPRPALGGQRRRPQPAGPGVDASHRSAVRTGTGLPRAEAATGSATTSSFSLRERTVGWSPPRRATVDLSGQTLILRTDDGQRIHLGVDEPGSERLG
jgi:hypothetical protein